LPYIAAMSGFTRAPTGFSNPDDWIFRFDGKDIGRCYAGQFGTNQNRWRWSIYGTNLMGMEDSLRGSGAGLQTSLWGDREIVKTNSLCLATTAQGGTKEAPTR
jgi:hypothetical protein